MTSETPPRPRPLRRAVSLAVRLALVVLTVLLGVYCIRAFDDLLQGPSQVSNVAAESEPSPVEGLVSPIGSEGGWQVSRLPYRMRVEEVSDRELSSRLTSPPPKDALEAPMDREMLAFLRLREENLRISSEGQPIGFDDKHVRVRVFGSVTEKGLRWSLARLALDTGSGWQLLEMSPVVHSSGHRGESLLPLPSNCQVLARRVDAQNRVQADLIRVSGSNERLISHWTRAGWRVEGDLTVSATCWHGNDQIRAWRPGDDGGILFLIR